MDEFQVSEDECLADMKELIESLISEGLIVRKANAADEVS